MHTFDYSFLRGLSISPAFAKRLMNIEGFRVKSKDIRIDTPDMARDMMELSKMMSARESNDIEGISTEDSRLISLLKGNVRPMGHDEYEILGYRDALDKVHNDHHSMEVDEDTILSLYSTLVGYTDMESGYKRRNNEIVDKASDGRILKRYRTVPAAEVKDCMYQLIGAFNDAYNDMGISNILLIPCFIMDFLKIHPFMDGNGRMSRLLTILLMYHEGLDVCSYESIESIINSSKKDYYEALELSGEGWFDNTSDYMPFIDYTIGVIFLAYRELDRRMALCTGKDNKENRIERLLMNVSMPISKKEIHMLMPDVSETYIEFMLSKLSKDGKIERMGAAKNSRYRPRIR